MRRTSPGIIALVCKTAQREPGVETPLPVEPAGAAGGVRYRNVQQIVSSELRSGSSFHKWFTECQRLSVIVPAAKALRNTR